MEYQGPIEAALTTDMRGEPYNFAVWDTYTNAQLVVFKGAKKAPQSRCLAMLDNNYFLTATDNVINVWSIYNKKCQEQKLFLSSRPTCLTVSPCGNYLIVGLSETMSIWCLKTGNLLSTVQKHYQPINVVKTSHDGVFIVSGGQDGHALVWCFADLVNHNNNLVSLRIDSLEQESGMMGGVSEPKYSWTHHESQVTDIHISHSGLCLTVSLDSNINIYSFRSGRRLYSVIMPSELWSIAMNKNETRAFVGGQDGNIYELVLSDIGLSLFNSTTKVRDPIFVGHTGKVNLLKTSLDGSRLISGSADSTCKVWDIRNKKLLQDIKHQGALANLELLFVPDGLAIKSMTEVKPPLLVKQLKRVEFKLSNKLVSKDEVFNDAVHVIHNSTIQLTKYLNSNHQLQNDDTCNQNIVANDTNKVNNSSSSTNLATCNNNNSSGDEVRNVSTTNSSDLWREKFKNLYRLAAEKIFKDASSDIMKSFEPQNIERQISKLNNNKNQMKRKTNGLDQQASAKKTKKSTG